MPSFEELAAIDEPRVGRRTKLTPELVKLFLETYRMTCNLTASAHRCGVDISTVMEWRARGRGETTRRGLKQRVIYTEFDAAVTRARGDFIALTAVTHHRFANGGIIKRPVCEIIETDKGKITTNKVIRNEAKEIEWDEYWVDPSEGASAWELSRLDPETYALRDDQAPRVNVSVETPNVYDSFLGAMSLIQTWAVLPEPRPRKLIESKAKEIETTATPVPTEEG